MRMLLQLKKHMVLRSHEMRMALAEDVPEVSRGWLFFWVSRGGAPYTGWPHTTQPHKPDCRGQRQSLIAEGRLTPYARRCPAPGSIKAWESNPHTSLVCYSKQLHTPDWTEPAAPMKGSQKKHVSNQDETKCQPLQEATPPASGWV
jgi:hypothetical protein